jgi:hypothetical protein
MVHRLCFSLRQPRAACTSTSASRSCCREHPIRHSHSKIAFEVAVQANRVTPITLPAIGCMVLLGAAPRALTLRELQGEILRLVRWAHERDIRLTSDFSPERLGQVRDLANAMVGRGLLIRYDEGSDIVFGLDPARHPMASYYRNTIIHHFVNKAILELALLAPPRLRQRLAPPTRWRRSGRKPSACGISSNSSSSIPARRSSAANWRQKWGASMRTGPIGCNEAPRKPWRCWPACVRWSPMPPC